MLLWEEKEVRSFILPDYYYYRSVSLSSSDYDDIVSNFKLLRALSLVSYMETTLPNRLGKLKHLRYLDLSFSDFKELPNSITELYNLETLILRSCRNLVSLPSDIQNLINLRHLEIDDCVRLIHMPRGIGEMTSLQTLRKFIVGGNQSSQSQCAGFGELIKLNNLRGHLTIQIWSIKVTPTELGAAQYLKDKEHLQSLVFDDWVDADPETLENAKETLERLEPPQNIKSIDVSAYPGETFPNWLSLLNHLVRLELSFCMQCKYLPPLHHLSSLQKFSLRNLEALEYVSEWDIEGGNLSTSSKSLTMSFFPSLRRLEITNCFNLKEWLRPSAEHQQPYFPILTNLEISNCPLLTSIPLFPNLENLQLSLTSSKPLQQMIMMKWKSDSDDVAIASSSSTSSSCPTSALSKLKFLNISNVNDLESLSEGIGNLSSLTGLRIKRCNNLTSLPKEIGSLSSLRDLRIEGCSNLTSFPEGIDSLLSLTDLKIEVGSNLTSLLKGIGNFSSLAYLRIKGCSNLNLRIEGWRNLTLLPKGIDSLLSLTNLAIEVGSNLTSLPEGISSLSSLKVLRIEGCSSLTSLPEGIGSLSLLTELTIEGCSSLTSLPEGIGSLSLLTKLTIEGCSSLTSLPERIGRLSSLTDLIIEGVAA